ncbi:hypothetical protein Vadar_015139 [Vaccinium darrowii]|uniref:Uncharacterized protein n=1 Tax=Vaccinium darrowii TaxID=229202 RepID=A0ACB7YVM9_9ERIC|nr:hypothetical protein Vadar_015139 [Vaccinium darrowii]
MRSEKEDNILTDRELSLMNAIAKVFPCAKNMLCRWHIQKNVLANCKKHFDDAHWKKFLATFAVIMYAPTIEVYDERVRDLKRDFMMYPTVLEYVDKTWLGPHKERFVCAWTDSVMHLGNYTTNRAEGHHNKLKKYLASSQCNFQNAWEKAHGLVEATITAIKCSFEKSLSTLQHSYKIPIFNNLVGVVSQDAMRYMEMELKKIHSINMECTTPCVCPLRHTHGLPCAHEIAPFKNKEEQLPLSLIHEHWKKLSFDKPKKDPTIAESMKANFDIFMERFSTYDEDHQRHLMRKMTEVIYPHSTSLTEPKVKAKVRG